MTDIRRLIIECEEECRAIAKSACKAFEAGDSQAAHEAAELVISLRDSTLDRIEGYLVTELITYQYCHPDLDEKVYATARAKIALEAEKKRDELRLHATVIREFVSSRMGTWQAIIGEFDTALGSIFSV